MTRHFIAGRLLTVLVASLIAAASAQGQWTITYTYDMQQAELALGAERVAPMAGALDRVKTRLESVLMQSTGNVQDTVSFEDPGQGALASALSSYFRAGSPAFARDRLVAAAVGANEPQAEIDMYNFLPGTTIPFHWDAAGLQQSQSVICTAALNKHVQFGTVNPGPDGTIRVRPPTPTQKWQFWKGKLLPQHVSFETTIIHETFHLLGFLSAADTIISPLNLHVWDLFRFPEASAPLTSGTFASTPRELRPDMEAAWITRVNSASAGVFKAARGSRSGGDGDQASHWRSRTRLTPPETIGIMDPAADYSSYTHLQLKFFTRADIEALDPIGWAVDPNAVQYTSGTLPSLIAPLDSQILTTSTPTFEWEPVSGEWSSALFIYSGADTLTDDPFRVYDELLDTEFTLPFSDALPPGLYSWKIVSESQPGYDESEIRTFTIQGPCVADFDGNSLVEIADIFAFLNAWFASDLSADIDGNTLIEVPDIFLFLELWFAGC